MPSFSRLTISCLKTCFPISLLDLLPTSLIILHIKAPMTNQSDRSTPQFVHSTLTIQPTFLSYLYIFFFFYATPRFLLQMTCTRHTKGLPTGNDRRPKGGPEDPTIPRNRRHRRAALTALAFPGVSRQGTAGVTADG